MDDAAKHFDYEETVLAFCTVTGCDWSEPVTWFDLADDAPSPNVRDRHAAHFAEAHVGAGQKENTQP